MSKLLPAVALVGSLLVTVLLGSAFPVPQEAPGLTPATATDCHALPEVLELHSVEVQAPPAPPVPVAVWVQVD